MHGTLPIWGNSFHSPTCSGALAHEIRTISEHPTLIWRRLLLPRPLWQACHNSEPKLQCRLHHCSTDILCTCAAVRSPEIHRFSFPPHRMQAEHQRHFLSDTVTIWQFHKNIIPKKEDKMFGIYMVYFDSPQYTT